MMYEKGFVEVDAAVFYTFIKDNNLTPKEDGMHTFYLNNKGESEALRLHGLVDSDYYIKSDKEYYTLKFVTQLINSKG